MSSRANDIKQAIGEFLTSQDSSLESSRRIARDSLNDLIGGRVYRSRVPQSDDGTFDSAITISRSAGQVFSGLSGPVGFTESVFNLTIWTRDAAGREGRDEEIFFHLRKLLHQYRGPLNEHFTVQTISLVSEPFDGFTSPIDGSDQWTFRTMCSFLFAHNIPAANPHPIPAATPAPPPPAGLETDDMIVEDTFTVT